MKTAKTDARMFWRQ